VLALVEAPVSVRRVFEVCGMPLWANSCLDDGMPGLTAYVDICSASPRFLFKSEKHDDAALRLFFASGVDLIARDVIVRLPPPGSCSSSDAVGALECSMLLSPQQQQPLQPSVGRSPCTTARLQLGDDAFRLEVPVCPLPPTLARAIGLADALSLLGQSTGEKITTGLSFSVPDRTLRLHLPAALSVPMLSPLLFEGALRDVAVLVAWGSERGAIPQSSQLRCVAQISPHAPDVAVFAGLVESGVACKELELCVEDVGLPQLAQSLWSFIGRCGPPQWLTVR
jgi:hypothetical protein